MRRAAFLLAWTALAAPCQAAERPAPPSQPVLFSADEVEYDQDLGLTVAKGNVELDQGNQILLADTVTYNQRSDTVTASGNIAMLQPTGDITFADFVELHDNMRDGFIKDIRLLMSDRSRLVGNTARRIDGTRTEIRRAVYSPCELCQDDPTRPPVWQIKAAEVTHDKELQLVEYRDAIMELDGVPVLYSPYFSHPDPSVRRASGFLPPILGYGNLVGTRAVIPYYWDIAPDTDITFRPELTSSAGAVLGGEYRERFANGEMVNDGSIEAGGGSESVSASGYGPPTGPVRGDIIGSGLWDLDQDWRAGYQLQRESDQTYMLRYSFEVPPNQLTSNTIATTFGQTPSNYLTTNFFAENFGANSYGIVSAGAFQSLNPFYGDSTEPVTLPSASYDWTSNPDSVGGRWHLGVSGLDLLHLTGPEVRRLTDETDWSVPFSGPAGSRFTFSAGVRADGYDSDQVALTPNYQILANPYGGQNIELPSNTGTVSAAAGRVLPTLALKWRDPWISSSDNGSSVLIEPIGALIASPNGENPAKIPDEDSQGFEFDETSLLVTDRLPGYDRVDSGQRVDYGLHGEFQSTSYGDWETLFGQSYRFEESDLFLPGSGLSDRLSDIVGRVTMTPGQSLNFFYRWRVDKDDLAMRRQEAGFSVGPQSLRVSGSFIAVAPIPGPFTLPTGPEVNAAVEAQLTRYWSVAVNDTRSFGTGGATIISGLAVTYRDDCFAVVGSVAQSGISVGDVRPGVNVLLTFVFKNLGEVGERVLSANGP